MKVEKFTDGDVSKYVFVKDDVCYEAVLYKYPTYEERTVLCISTQCGCPVGCTFCGTGEQFIRNLTASEMVDQVKNIMEDIGFLRCMGQTSFLEKQLPKKFQIMFMSMGEPFLNYDNVQHAIKCLNKLFPNADLLLSTIGPDRKKDFSDFIMLSESIERIGLQFSIHKSTDDARDELIPFEKKMGLIEIRNYGVEWYAQTGRQVYLNYCIDGTNTTWEDYIRLKTVFPPCAFAFTFSVICSADETMKDAGYRNIKTIQEFEQLFLNKGYNTRIFDPSSQDSIGGGCGQLWYVQKWMKENKGK